MQPTPFFIEKNQPSIHHEGKNVFTTTNSFSAPRSALIRFEEKKETYTWVDPEKILFVKSADHYVKSLIQQGDQKKWMIRHSTIKDLLTILTYDHFVRLNRFYILNTNHFSYLNEAEKTIYLDDDFSILIPHRISRYILELLKKISVREMHFTKYS